MAVFAKEWFAVPPGAIYPVTYREGDECPPALEGEARALGLLREEAPAKSRKGRG